MYLVEKHIINRNHKYYNECDILCFKSKNIYNQSLYNVRQHYFKNKSYLNYNENYHKVKEQESYKELPTKVSCQTIKMVDKNFKSFFVLLKNKNIKNKIPKYLDSITGRYLVKYPKQAINTRTYKKNGLIGLSQTNIFLNSKVDIKKIQEIRIVPKNLEYVIEVVYEKEIKQNNGNIIASIDLGLNNLATITFSDGSQPIIINGKPLKSINQYYNKKASLLKSKLKNNNNKSKSNKLIILTNKRNKKVNDYIHKSSRIIVNQLVLKNVKTLIIGKNINQKQDINIGRVNNQNFTQIPTFKMADTTKYKAELEGMNVIYQEESYTSKASFLNLDDIPIYPHKNENVFSGYRVSRGIYKIKNSNLKINADVNGSYNIMRKAVPNLFNKNGIEGFGVIPLVITPKK